MSIRACRVSEPDSHPCLLSSCLYGVCQAQLCTFNDSLSKLNESNAKVFGISVDGPLAPVLRQPEQHRLPLLSDHQRTTITDYDITFANFAATEGYTVAERSVFIIDAEG